LHDGTFYVHEYFKLMYHHFLFGILLTLVLTNCSSQTTEIYEGEYLELDEYKAILSYEEMQLFTPTVMAFDEGTLFVYDYAVGHVLTFDTNGELTGEIGRSGQGPGEFYLLNNIFVYDQTLYFVDFGQVLIHSYTKNGEHIHSVDYGAMGYITSPAPPMSTGAVMARDVTHQPHVTPRGDFLLSPFLAAELPVKIFDLVNRDGKVISRIGNVPEGSTRTMEPDEHRVAVSNNEVPPLDYANVFPVNDSANPDEFFLVYTAFPKIIKYSITGNKLWESEIISTPELDDVTERYYDVMDQITRSSWIPLNKYMSGVSSPKGELFLATNTNPEMPGPLWIHHFGNEGQLLFRYKLVSDVNIPPIFDIDHEKQRIFVITEDGEIRAYSF
jgi:hypothetical protein